MAQDGFGKRARLLFASAVGTIIEWYDFFIFATCAVLVFDKAFFPTADPAIGVLLGLSTFAIGFIARPLGGIIFGVLGDRIGRKNALVVSLAMMGGSTFAMGLLPTYASVGVLAPVLLVLLRIFQGIAVGGEATGALLIVAESMPGKQRGFWTSFPMVGGPAANVLAAATISFLTLRFGEQAFIDWAWRLPFLFSIILVVLGFWMRRKVEESPAFIELVEKRKSVPGAPLSEAFKHFSKPMGQVFLVKTAENTLFYLFTTFFLVLTVQYLGLARSVGVGALFWGSILEVVVIMAAAYASDRFGRKPLMLLGLVGGLAAGAYLFSLPHGADPQLVLQATLLTLTFHGIIVGSMAPFFTELFPTHVRYSAMSISYQVASVVGGSVAPLIATLLLGATGSPHSVIIYAAVMVIPGIICVLLSKETHGRDLTAII
ncbi:MFS transporter [Phyllobacterium sp. P30BS-XVII]|uniref:MFS transporter n=1 Tax=Phyllobacterium sp. P30BS-XVII TaxID=2587046 RepID=UPI000DD96E9C|nr:MFS transporter [Phyllobacterium sp. P30BS-XVII]MBA8900020.1 MFS family permease [Phyllobacterium sp. P30BS-XVII]